MPYYIAPPPMSPLSRLLAGVLAILAMAGAFFFGLFILAFAVGVGFVAWLVLWVRLRWMRHKAPRPADRQADVIEAEYTVVSRQDED